MLATCLVLERELQARDWVLPSLEFQTFNVTAVPEPETYAMLLAGLGLIGFMSRRNSKQS